MRRRDRRGERGQTLAFITLFMTGLLGMGAIAIDVGQWYLAHRNAQNIADAAALAGVAQLPAGAAAATAAATANGNVNRSTGDVVTPSIVTSSGGTANDTVRVVVQRTVQGTFSRIFLGGDRTVSASAEATVRSYTRVGSDDDVMPWAVMRGTYTPGSAYSVYADNSSPNNGAVNLDVVNGSTCQTSSGANDYRDTISGDRLPCAITIGDVLEPKTGGNAGPTEHGLCTRINGTSQNCQAAFQPWTNIVQLMAGGQANVLQPDSPQLVLVPIVVNNQDGSTTWPNGSGTVRVVGYAVFVITGYADSGRTVNGVFVGNQTMDLSNPTGNWDPTSSLYTTVLTR